MGKAVKTYRLGRDEELLVRVAAERLGLAPSTFVREAAVERAARVVLGQKREPEAGAELEPNLGAVVRFAGPLP